MTPLYAGLMCTLLLIGTVADLFGCMSAVRCHRPFVYATMNEQIPKNIQTFL